MKLVRLRAVARKEFLHVFRDRLSLAIAIALPLILMVIFGFALSFDVKHVPLVVWDQSQTQLSRDLVSQFTGSPYFRLADYARSYPELQPPGQSPICQHFPRTVLSHFHRRGWGQSRGPLGKRMALLSEPGIPAPHTTCRHSARRPLPALHAAPGTCRRQAPRVRGRPIDVRITPAAWMTAAATWQFLGLRKRATKILLT